MMREISGVFRAGTELQARREKTLSWASRSLLAAGNSIDFPSEAGGNPLGTRPILQKTCNLDLPLAHLPEGNLQ